ncbi:urate hydroxylase PuuD [SAR86 cluster bacterium]|nr:urate hydroxylase PuuD [SAR86 cluster bacterium]
MVLRLVHPRLTLLRLVRLQLVLLQLVLLRLVRLQLVLLQLVLLRLVHPRLTLLRLVLLLYVQERMITTAITLGTLMGTIMMLNVWGIIWRNQKIVIGLKEGDAVAAGAKAALASRTNTLLSLPMLYFMVSSAHGGSAAYPKSYLLIDGYLSTGFWIVFVAVLLIEMNAIFGKMFPVITSVRSVITSSLLLTIVCSGLVFYL